MGSHPTTFGSKPMIVYQANRFLSRIKILSTAEYSEQDMDDSKYVAT